MNIKKLAFLLLIPFLQATAAERNCIEKPVPIARPYTVYNDRPVLTTGAIIEIYDEGQFQGIALIKRGKIPFGIALPGGKVECGETVEEAIRREMMEETNLKLEDLRQFHVYSDPQRDPRHHSIEVTYLAKANSYPIAGDDAKEAFVVKIEEIPWENLTFDHNKILKDYIAYRHGDKTKAIIIP